MTTQAGAETAASAAHVRAREIEEQMTDDERFSLIVSLIGAVPSIGVPRDERIHEDVTNISAGYTPGVPRLGIPAIQSSDASMGVTILSCRGSAGHLTARAGAPRTFPEHSGVLDRPSTAHLSPVFASIAGKTRPP